MASLAAEGHILSDTALAGKREHFHPDQVLQPHAVGFVERDLLR